VFKQIHALISSSYQEICAVKPLQNFPKTYETRLVQLNSEV